MRIVKIGKRGQKKKRTTAADIFICVRYLQCDLNVNRIRRFRNRVNFIDRKKRIYVVSQSSIRVVRKKNKNNNKK